MNEEMLEKVTTSRLTRRKIVTTGTKLAYAAPLVAATMSLSRGVTFAETLDVLLCPNVFCDIDPTQPGANDAVCKTVICHRTCSEEGGNQHDGYSAIQIPDPTCSPSEALAQHMLQHQHPCSLEDVLATNLTYDNQGRPKTGECPGGGVLPVSSPQ
jgi:hypothetical protein